MLPQAFALRAIVGRTKQVTAAAVAAALLLARSRPALLQVMDFACTSGSFNAAARASPTALP
jgi:hypothetical protein